MDCWTVISYSSHCKHATSTLIFYLFCVLASSIACFQEVQSQELGSYFGSQSCVVRVLWTLKFWQCHVVYKVRDHKAGTVRWPVILYDDGDYYNANHTNCRSIKPDLLVFLICAWHWKETFRGKVSLVLPGKSMCYYMIITLLLLPDANIDMEHLVEDFFFF